MAFRVAVIGATGAVGRRFLGELERRRFPVGKLKLFASGRSEGKTIPWQGAPVPCEVLRPGCFEGVDFAFFDASDAVSEEWVEPAARAGAWVIDNSAVYRMDPEVPLSVPELHGKALVDRFRNPDPARWKSRVFAGPNCSTVQLALPLEAIRRQFGLARVVVSTYQSTSGAGVAAMEALRSQTEIHLQGRPLPDPKPFPRPIAFNAIPQIGSFKGAGQGGLEGFTSEEAKLMGETRRILGLPELRIVATAVRVPTLSCHAESVWVECEREVDRDSLLNALAAFPGVSLASTPEAYVTGAQAAGQDPVYVGRVRRDPGDARALSLWIVSDNLGKGAALNAIQIAERGLEALQ